MTQIRLFPFIVFVISCVSLLEIARAHTPVLLVEENKDGTIYIEPGFADGSSPAGHDVELRDEKTGELIERLVVPEEGFLEVSTPDVRFIAVFKPGRGHSVTAKDPRTAEESDEVVEEPDDTLEGYMATSQDTPEQSTAAATQSKVPTEKKEADENARLQRTFGLSYLIVVIVLVVFVLVLGKRAV